MDTVQQDLKMKVLNSNSSSITELTLIFNKLLKGRLQSQTVWGHNFGSTACW